MQLLKIIITLIVLIALGIFVGSNLIPTMTVTFLSQPTIALPIGLWVAIAIGMGLLSSSIFQLVISLERRSLDRQIRQLRSRLQQDEDVFTYTPKSADIDEQSEERVSGEGEPTEPRPKKSIFGSYRANFSQRLKSPPPKRVVVDDGDDDWDAPPVANRQLDWDDAPAPRQQQPSAERSYAESVSRDEVYDADFRLIQPPYREPVDRFDYPEPEDDDEDDDEVDEPRYSDYRSPSPSNSTNRDAASKQSADDEDWGFDFDDEDTPSRNSRSKNRKF